uniref:STAS domain-containing protein n=1 Tax=Oryza punctata TaxID=4537 RepID=A0A0E0KA05_ORYPU
MEDTAAVETPVTVSTFDVSRHPDTARLVLSSPKPPGVREEFVGVVRKAFRPRASGGGGGGGEGRTPPARWGWVLTALQTVFPVLQWGRTYNLKLFRSDVMAGLTLASLGIPQSIGYANLAKLDPQYDTSVVPPLIYAVMGTSREIAIGPVAVVSLLLSSMISKIVDPAVDPVTYRALVFTVTFLAGVFQVSFGLFRLGFLVDFLSHAAIVGFMAGAAIVIGLQQLKGLLGLSHFTNSTDVVSVIKAVCSALRDPWHPGNFLIGCSFLIFILATRFIGRRYKKLFWLSAISPLLSVILSTAAVFATRADKHGVKIIQRVHAGLNPSSASQLRLSGPYTVDCAKTAIICAIIALTEAIAVGRSFASIRGYKLDGNKEMIAMGCSNVAGSLSSCYVATGSFSRTAVNFSAGARSTVSNIVMSITVFIALELLMKSLYYTPIAVLASIILSALPGLIDIKEALSIWKVDKMDFLTCLGAFVGVLFGSVEIGLAAALAISFAKIIIQSIRPQVEVLGRLQGTNIFCSVRQYPVACRIPNVVNIDTSGISALEEIHKELASLSIQMAIAGPGWQAIQKMKLAGVVDQVGGDWIFLTVGEAVEACPFPQGVHPNTSEPAMEPMASEPSVPKGTAFADLLLQGPEPPSLWNDLTGMFRKAFRWRGADKRFTLSVYAMSVLQGIFPILDWWKTYNLKFFQSDLMAGLTLASLSIPQSIGYATLAKLDPQYGLYTSVVPPLVYAVTGSSREIAIGPVAIVSLLLSSMIQKIVDPSVDPAFYRKMVFTVTFLTGVFQFAFGLFRLGFLVDFLSHAAIVGFMGGAAIVIGLQQLKGLLGLSHFTNRTDVVSVSKAVWVSVHETWHPENVFIGCSFFMFILAMRFIGRKYKKLFWVSAIAPVLSVALSTLFVYATRADKHGVKIIQKVNSGINASSVEQIDLKGGYAAECAKIALVCAVIALTEAVAVGRSFSAINGYRLDGNKEMVAMGFMNIAGSLSSCYVATGSFSRTAVNFAAGCKTTVSNIIMAATVMVALELLTKLLYYTPVSILASIILSALPGLINVQEVCFLWKVDKMDFLTCMGSFLGVLFGSVEIGLSVALVVSFAKIIIQSIRAQVEILGRLQGTEIFCNVKQYPLVHETPTVLTVRIETSFLCFVNASSVKEKIMGWVTNEREVFRSVVLDMSNVVNMDTSGLAALEELHKEMVCLGIQMAIARPGWQVIHKMKQARLVDGVGAGWFFLTVGEAVEACLGNKAGNALECC